MLGTIIGWIFWGGLAVFALGCFVGSRHSNPIDLVASRVMGLVLALGLALVVVFHIPKFYLLWVLFVGFVIDSLINHVLLSVHENADRTFMRNEITKQIAGEIIIAAVLVIVTVIYILISATH